MAQRRRTRQKTKCEGHPFGLGEISKAGQPNRGADLLGIGMARAGTSWLFDNLKCHPDFWVPPIKGTYYLDKAVRAQDNGGAALHRYFPIAPLRINAASKP
jgi:hypothetical protein